MKIADLGDLAGEVLLMGGVYSNFQALEAFQDVVERTGVPASRVICLGDVVAYCADGAACAAQVEASGWAALAGNCEVQLAARALDCGCGYADGSECSLLSRGWFAHADATIGTRARAWMGELPDWLVFTHCGRRYAALHGGASDIARFIWPVTVEAEIAAEIALVEAQVGSVNGVIAGHSGIAMIQDVAGKQWFNPGALGMPPHDGDPRGSYGILGENGFEIKRLEYDFEVAAQRMEQVGLTQGYHMALRTGFWPSEDTLPEAMRR